MGGPGSGTRLRGLAPRVNRTVRIDRHTDGYLARMECASTYLEAVVEQRRQELRRALRLYSDVEGGAILSAARRLPEEEAEMSPSEAMRVIRRELDAGNTALVELLAQPLLKEGIPHDETGPEGPREAGR